MRRVRLGLTAARERQSAGDTGGHETAPAELPSFRRGLTGRRHRHWSLPVFVEWASGALIPCSCVGRNASAVIDSGRVARVGSDRSAAAFPATLKSVA
ncbi:hypothetical protein L838_3355 [Mycobacterium avium MAV_120709_2344]|nr:hypothetical protein L838_3355 [Mycobacterium avium MAV_120709_2344]